MSKDAVLGLDGATWDLMTPLAAEGFLPNLQKVVQEGSWGELESTLPPVTAPAWASFATGKNPGKTGLFDFLMPRDSLANLSPVTSRDISGETLYEIIDDHGLNTILINLPLSYPPRTQQPTITCMLTQGTQFIFPPGLKRTIPELADYRLVPDFNLRAQGRLQDYAQDIRALERVRSTCAQKLFHTDWDLFFLLFSGTDWIQHDLYEKMLSNALPRGHAAFQLLRDIDGYIGWFHEHLPREAYLLIMSDHGFRSYKGTFLLNQWLRESKLLSAHFVKQPPRVYSHLVEKGMTEAVTRRSSERNRVATVLSSVRLLAAQEMDHLRSRRFQAVIEELNPARMGRLAAIDYSKTLATCTSPQLSGIYVNSAAKFRDGIVPDRDLQSVKHLIMAGLQELRDPTTGEPAFAGVMDNGQAYSGEKASLGPDIVISPQDWLVMPQVTPTSRASLFMRRPINSHARTGMFLGYGPGVRRNHRIHGARIEDIAPTILYLLGLPCPADLDGHILTELLDSPVAAKAEPDQPLRIHEQRRIGRTLGRLKDSRSI